MQKPVAALSQSCRSVFCVSGSLYLQRVGELLWNRRIWGRMGDTARPKLLSKITGRSIIGRFHLSGGTSSYLKSRDTLPIPSPVRYC